MSKFGRRRSRQTETDRQMSRYEREEVVEEYDEYDDENEFEGEIELDPVEVDRLLQRLEGEQNFPMAVVGGLLGAVVGAGLWGGIVIAFRVKSGLFAILVGILVGLLVRHFGKGLDTQFGILGGVMSLLSCLLGIVFASFAFFMKSKGLSFSELLPYINANSVVAVIKSSLSGIDLVFFGIAAYEGYSLSFRNIDPEFEELAMKTYSRR